MPNIGHNEIDDNESTEEYIPMRRADSNENYALEPDQLMGTTAGGKKLYMCKHPTYAGYYFKFVPGGQIPANIDGVWLTAHEGKKQAELYLAANAEANAIDVKPSKKEVK